MQPFKLLVAVKSCARDFQNGSHDQIRSTWGQQFRGLADVRFFLGRAALDTRWSPNAKSDEVQLGCDDSFMGLTWKVHDICLWTVGKAYTHILLVDNDTYLNAKKVLSCGFQYFDYQGFFNHPLDGGVFDYNDVDPLGISHYYRFCYPWASGGRGYFLSRDAFMAVADKYPNQSEWAEDFWVGQIIGRGASKGEFTINSVADGAYSWHYPVERGYDPASGWMSEMHTEHGK